MDTLPDETLLHIMAMMPIKDILRLSSTSKRLQKIGSDRAVWRNRVPEAYQNKPLEFIRKLKNGKVCHMCHEKRSSGASVDRVKEAFGFVWCYNCIRLRLLPKSRIWNQLILYYSVSERKAILAKARNAQLDMFGYSGTYYVCRDIIDQTNKSLYRRDGTKCL